MTRLSLMDVDPRVQQAYNVIMRHFVDTGRAPHFTALARTLGVDVEEARRLQAEAVELGVGAWFIAGTDTIESFAPFYNVPTNAVVSVDGDRRWYGQCGHEALNMRFVFPGREVRVESACLDCGDRVVVTSKDEEILDVDPGPAVALMNGPLNPVLRAGISGSVF